MGRHRAESCTQPAIDTLESTCTVTLNAEGDIEDFTFVDEWEAGLSVERDGFTMQKKSASGDLVDIEWNPDFEWNVEGQVSLKTDKLPNKENGTRFLPKGEYVITYTTQINDKARPNDSGNQYVNAGNTGKWQWNVDKEETGEETSTVTPNVPEQITSG